MRRLGALLGGLLAIGLTSSAPAAAPPATVLTAPPPEQGPDPARALAGQILEALGGARAWKATRFLRFDFAVEDKGKEVVRRAHTWDKWTGRYRLEGKNKEGQAFVVLMNVNSKEGSAVVGGKPAAGEELKQLLERGYATWVNDTYWLLMPYKMLDPGVVLAMDGESKAAGAAWDKVRLSFDKVGLTPGDRYWAYVNRTTRLVDRWDYVLQSAKPGDAPTSWEWRGWKSYGGIKLAPERWNEKDQRKIHFPVLEVPEAVPDALFTTP
jgi:hypothetical protein